MLNTIQTFDHLMISKTSPARAVQEVGQILDDALNPVQKARELFYAFVSVDVEFKDDIRARIASKYLVSELVICHGIVEDEDKLVQEVMDKTEVFVTDPRNSYMYAETRPTYSSVPVFKKEVVEGLSHVEVKENGKIKKGGKQLLALELFHKHLKELHEGNLAYKPGVFKKILEDELDMTTAGASTYEFNVRTGEQGIEWYEKTHNVTIQRDIKKRK